MVEFLVFNSDASLTDVGWNSFDLDGSTVVISVDFVKSLTPSVCNDGGDRERLIME
ncbi:hypothetical protein ACFL2V_21060 [Pseudomonadota bacterium]